MTDSELGALMKCSHQAVSSRRRALSVARSKTRDEAAVARLQSDPLLLLSESQRESYRRKETFLATLSPLLTSVSVRCVKCLAIIVLDEARENGGVWLHCDEVQPVVAITEAVMRREMNPTEPET